MLTMVVDLGAVSVAEMMIVVLLLAMVLMVVLMMVLMVILAFVPIAMLAEYLASCPFSVDLALGLD